MNDNDFDYLKGQAFAFQTALSHLLSKLPPEALKDVNMDAVSKGLAQNFKPGANAFAAGFKDTMEHFIP